MKAQEPQTLSVSISFKDTTYHQNTWHISSLKADGQQSMIKLKAEEGLLVGEVPASTAGIYKLSGVYNGAQIIAPLYLQAGSPISIQGISVEEGCPKIDIDADNQALSAFNAIYYNQSRNLWMEGRNMDVSQVLDILKSFKTSADSIATQHACAEPVKQYLSLWAYTATDNLMHNIKNITGRKDGFPYKKSDILEDPATLFDTPIALYFSSATLSIAEALPDGSLKEKVAYLQQHFSCEPIRNRVADGLIAKYIRQFDYANKYEAGLAELTEVVETYGLNAGHLKDFKSRRASVKGSPFPTEVILTDADGNRVNFDSFKGYYVYIDMWASWCVPCRREVPHLQKLEKELQNEQVKFVSISIDQNEEAWKKAMKNLNMHGIQLLNKDNQLGNILNISGIPHFLIYDKEGKLYQYKALRPSSGEELKGLLEGLK